MKRMLKNAVQLCQCRCVFVFTAQLKHSRDNLKGYAAKIRVKSGYFSGAHSPTDSAPKLNLRIVARRTERSEDSYPCSSDSASPQKTSSTTRRACRVALR